jgi:hypothetical protein
MKKIITLFLAVCAIAGAKAQTSGEEARRVILGEGSGRTSPTQAPNDNNTNRQAEIDQVNREHDLKVAGVRSNIFMTADAKEQEIRRIEEERQRRIREINAKYGGYNSGNNNGSNGTYTKKNKNKNKKNKNWKDDDDDEYKEKKDNGKHLGWEKGKGNPHRNGGKVKKNKG